MTYKDVVNMYSKKGYIFRTEKMRLNLGAIRSKDSKSNKFDDLGFLAWIDENNQEQLLYYWVTTDPGKSYLLAPMKRDGCIITVPGQYLEVFAIGLHNGKYQCFKQVGKMAYVRDNNKDEILDFSLYKDPEKAKTNIFWDICNTNYHRAHEFKIVEYVFNYSAGCTVVKNPETYKKLIELQNKSSKFGFQRFDYTLFEEQ